MAYTIGKRYNITNEAIIGLLFLPVGIGNISTLSILSCISQLTVDPTSRCTTVREALGRDGRPVAREAQWRVGARGPSSRIAPRGLPRAREHRRLRTHHGVHPRYTGHRAQRDLPVRERHQRTWSVRDGYFEVAYCNVCDRWTLHSALLRHIVSTSCMQGVRRSCRR